MAKALLKNMKAEDTSPKKSSPTLQIGSLRKTEPPVTWGRSRGSMFHRLNGCDMLRRQLIVRIKAQRRVELIERRFESPLFRQCHTKVQMSAGIIRPQPNDRLKLLLSFRDFVIGRQFNSEQITRLPETRLEPH